MAELRARILAAFGGLALASGTGHAQPAPDTTRWSEETRRLWHEARAVTERRLNRSLRELQDDSVRLAAFSLREVSIPGLALRVPPQWEVAADSALRTIAAPLRDLGPLPPLRAAAVPDAEWPAPRRADRGPATAEGPIFFLPSGRPDADTITALANRLVADALKKSLNSKLADHLTGVPTSSPRSLHRRAGEALRAAGREGWRACAAGDEAMCLRALFPTREDSITRFLGPRDYRAHVIRDTFPLEVGMKRRCVAGDDAACEAWVRRFELTPDLDLPREVAMSFTSVALQTPGAASRLRSPGPAGTATEAAVMAANEARETLARRWRDTLVAAQRNTHEADGRIAVLAAPWILLFGLLAIGGRREAK